jgi:uncharacterized protein YegP (UPF0339 family)
MRFHVYRDQAGGWRWRLVSANGRVVADSGEAYTRRFDCEQAIILVTEGVARIQQRRVAEGTLPWA